MEEFLNLCQNLKVKPLYENTHFKLPYILWVWIQLETFWIMLACRVNKTQERHIHFSRVTVITLLLHLLLHCYYTYYTSVKYISILFIKYQITTVASRRIVRQKPYKVFQVLYNCIWRNVKQSQHNIMAILKYKYQTHTQNCNQSLSQQANHSLSS